jgi:hypothetical protein
VTFAEVETGVITYTGVDAMHKMDCDEERSKDWFSFIKGAYVASCTHIALQRSPRPYGPCQPARVLSSARSDA